MNIKDPGLFIVRVKVLRWTFANFLCDLRILSFSRIIHNGCDIYLVQPDVPEIEAISKSPANLQAQRIDGSGADIALDFLI